MSSARPHDRPVPRLLACESRTGRRRAGGRGQAHARACITRPLKVSPFDNKPWWSDADGRYLMLGCHHGRQQGGPGRDMQVQCPIQDPRHANLPAKCFDGPVPRRRERGWPKRLSSIAGAALMLGPTIL